MPDILGNTVDILQRLIGFESISGRPTHGIVGYIRDYLADQGIEATLNYDETGERAKDGSAISSNSFKGTIWAACAKGLSKASRPATSTKRHSAPSSK